MRTKSRLLKQEGLTLLLLLLFFAALAGQALKSPRMFIEKASIKISKIEVERSKLDLMRFDFTLVNKGDADLSILRVDPSCTCTNSEIKSKLIKSGKSTVLSLFIERNTLFPGKKVYAVIADNSKEKYHKVEVEITE